MMKLRFFWSPPETGWLLSASEVLINLSDDTPSILMNLPAVVEGSVKIRPQMSLFQGRQHHGDHFPEKRTRKERLRQ